MDEEWKLVPGFEDRYEASNLGRLKRLARTVSRGNSPFVIQEKIVGLGISNRGYHYVSTKWPHQENKLVHRLVALAWIPNPENKPYINHKDGCKTNNVITNLEWCTPRENMLHSFAMGLNKKVKSGPGENSGAHKLTNKDVEQIKLLLAQGFSYEKIGRMFRVREGTIGHIQHGRTWKHIPPPNHDLSDSLPQSK